MSFSSYFNISRAVTPTSAGALLLSALLLSLSACDKPAEEPPKPAPTTAPAPPTGPLVVKIGSASPLTGSQAHIGTDILWGVKIGVEDVNAANMQVNGRKLVLELIEKDDEADPTKAANIAQQLVDAKVVAVVGHFNSGASIAASKVYSDANVTQISPSSTNPKYTQQGFKTTFRVVANDDQQGPANAQYALTELKAKQIAVIDDSTPYGQGLADAFAKAATAGGATIIATEHTTDKDSDFKAILTKIKSKQPNLIFFGGIDPQAGPMVKQMRELGIKATFMGGDGIQTPEMIKKAGKFAEGVYASNPGLPKEQMPGWKPFLEKYKAKVNKEVELYAPMGYDAVFVIAEAIKRAGSANPAQVVAQVAKTNYNGVIGPIAFDDKGDLKNGPLTIYQVKGGQWVALKVMESSAPASPAPTASAPAPAPAPEPAKK